MLIQGLLLAAGGARRFGGPKLLAPTDDGRLVAVRSAHALLAAVPDVAAIVRPGDAALAARLGAAGCRIVACPHSARGMGASLACGVRATAQADAWLVALADMPWVSAATVRALAVALGAGHAIVAPVHGGRRGHPVGFHRRLRDELTALDGDQGARAVLRTHRDRLVLVPCDDPGVLRDVDRPADLWSAPGDASP